MKEESPILERPRIRFNSLKRIINKNVPCIAILQVSFSLSLHVIDFSIGLLAVDPRLTEEERTKILENLEMIKIGLENQEAQLKLHRLFLFHQRN